MRESIMQESRKWAKGKRLMAVFAHPDDEGQIAGIMAKYTSQGTEVYLVFATRGELGKTSDPSLLEGKTLAQLREEELRCVCRTLGVKSLRLLGYREGSFHITNPFEVIGKILDIIREYSPHVIVTFGPEGVYGHRDHVAISRLVTAAFYSVRKRSLSQGLRLPQKLYYTAYPRSLFERLRSQGVEFNIEIDGMIHRISGVPDERITTVIDVSNFQFQKREAFGCHRSQARAGDFRWMIMEGKLRDLLVTERLVRVFPRARGGETEDNLFDEIPSGMQYGSSLR
jgi:LmbE family N-acetylglucosaminyl deacetylase